MTEEFKILKVTVERNYYIPMHDERSEINGWTIEQIIEDWFKKEKHIKYCHASRDYYHIGGKDTFIKAEIKEDL